MAKITFGSGIQDMTGSVGGVTFQSNFSGQIARSRPVRSNRRTLRAVNQQGRLNQFQAEWSNLSCEQKEAWNNFAESFPSENLFGRIRNLTGYQYFMKLNARRQRANLDLFLDPPDFELPPDYQIEFGSLEMDNLSVKVIFAESQPLTQVDVFATPPLINANRAMEKYFRLVRHRTISGEEFDIGLSANYRNYFGLPSNGVDYPNMNFQVGTLLWNRQTGLGRSMQIVKNC